MDVIIVAIIVAISSTVGPVLLVLANGRQRTKEKQEDYARQDLVAAKADAVAVKAAEAAELLLAKQNQIAAQAAEAASLLVANNALEAETSKITIGKLDVIHTLVNSSLTKAIQDQLDANIATLALLNEVISLRSGGPSEETLAVKAKLEAKITELQVQLADRVKSAAIVQKQEKAAQEQGLGTL